MQSLLSLLTESCHDAVIRGQVVAQNLAATSSVLDAEAPKAKGVPNREGGSPDGRQGHREFSAFTPPEGRA